ncbi:unnamed protein product [Protopolystoma xenopodis]|uniref:Secreted protein n=1 Tax=Protopolystoma xenopodis TaxID=117903 RepID=A0A448XD69_9PLAT|nr:unnamed protein product [Protopolystoma xenopodis]
MPPIFTPFHCSLLCIISLACLFIQPHLGIPDVYEPQNVLNVQHGRVQQVHSSLQSGYLFPQPYYRHRLPPSSVFRRPYQRGQWRHFKRPPPTGRQRRSYEGFIKPPRGRSRGVIGLDEPDINNTPERLGAQEQAKSSESTRRRTVAADDAVFWPNWCNRPLLRKG